MNVFNWLEMSEVADWVRDAPWRWPLALTLHSLGTATLIGFVFILCFKVSGRLKALPYKALDSFMPAVWIALIVQLATGFLLFVTRPLEYSSDGAFEIKMVFLVLGTFLMASLQRTMRDEAESWDGAGKASSHAGTLALAAIAAWSGLLIATRLTAHLGSLVAG